MSRVYHEVMTMKNVTHARLACDETAYWLPMKGSTLALQPALVDLESEWRHFTCSRRSA